MLQTHRRTKIATLVLLFGLVLLAAPAVRAQTGDAEDARDILDRLFGRIVAQQTLDRASTTLRVRGTGTIRVDPDRAIVTLGVQRNNDRAAGAFSASGEAVASVVAALLDAGVAETDIQTGVFQFLPGEEPGAAAVAGAAEEPPPNLPNRVVNTVTVQTGDLDSIGELVETAVTAGADQVQSVRFTVADPERYRADAVAAALDAAGADARALADALGGRIVRIVEASVLDGEPVLQGPVRAVPAPDATGGVAPLLQSGAVSIGATVELLLEVSGASLPEPTLAVDDIEGEEEAQPEGNEKSASAVPPSSEESATEETTVRRDPATSRGDDAERPAGDAPAVAGGEDLVFEPVVQAPLARYRGSRPRVAIATSQIEWEQKLAPLLTRTVEIDADWDEEILLGVFLGERSSTGFGVKVERVSVEDDVLVLGVRVTEPGAEEDAMSAITSPFQIVRIQRDQLPVGEPGELATEFRELRGR